MARLMMHWAHMVLALVCGVSAALQVSIPGLGIVEGLQLGDVEQFLGLPYAQAPVNSLRWRPPLPAKPFAALYNATYYRPSCIQDDRFSPTIAAISEDCLFLNVFRPAQATSASRFPVMIWLHGGGYTHGGANEARLNGTYNVQQSGQHIIVTINYRLNILGFLGSEMLRMRTSDGSTGNYGIQDQRMALQWVQQYISAFGGDPHNVMLFGESAGAGSVANHLVMPQSWPYFHKAVMESGAFCDWNSQTFSTAQATFDSVLEATNCSNIDCLEALPAAGFLSPSLPQHFAPTIDGIELTDYPYNIVMAGNASLVHQVPIMSGYNRDEGVSFVGATPDGRNMTQSDAEEYFRNHYKFNDTTVARMLQLYNSSIHASTSCCTSWFWATIEAVGNEHMQCGARLSGLAWANMGLDVYAYSFNHVPFANATNEFSFHSAEIPYVFHVNELLDGTQGQHVADIVSQYWLNFATSSNPNQGEFAVNVEWPALNATSDLTMLLQAQPIVSSHHRGAECDFWKDRFVFG